ncbi:AsnC family transcriptional regulator [Halonatronum saccharophilum]|uniref:siroheme decarboxylase subunit beta n=1 Tax=Halonatronum saccharophilum TaxID=150060 RepID=UPI00047F1FD6|nr:AsnC family transcriptional regulator [Halonatronum saccharophilum]
MLSELDKDIVRLMQEDIPLVERPYRLIAQKVGISEEELLERLENYHIEGMLRRVGPVLYHRQAGYKANGMTAWRVPEDGMEGFADLLVGYSQITHLYQRPTYPDWPYNIFAMIHGKEEGEVESIAQTIFQSCEIDDYTILYSTEELKKCSMRYFMN